LAASQAIESFSRMTDQSGGGGAAAAFDWLDVRDGETAVRRRLFDLSRGGSGPLLPALLANSKGSYPGGG
jgi:hypothetical protein